MKKNITRRKALGLISAGVLLSITNSEAYTSNTINREIDFEVTDTSKLDVSIQNPIEIETKGNSSQGKRPPRTGPPPDKGKTVTKQLCEIKSKYEQDIPVTVDIITPANNSVSVTTNPTLLKQNQTENISVDITTRTKPQFITFSMQFTIDNTQTVVLERETNVTYT